MAQAEENGGDKKDVALARRTQVAQEFEHGAGKVLQERLIGEQQSGVKFGGELLIFGSG